MDMMYQISQLGCVFILNNDKSGKLFKVVVRERGLMGYGVKRTEDQARGQILGGGSRLPREICPNG